jgi:hypothetical protein
LFPAGVNGVLHIEGKHSVEIRVLREILLPKKEDVTGGG